MAEAIGTAAAILQFLDVALRLTSCLDRFCSDVRNVPLRYRQLQTDLRQQSDLAKQIQTQLPPQAVAFPTLNAPLLEYSTIADELCKTLETLLPKQNDGLLQRGWSSICSLRKKQEVESICDRLEQKKSTVSIWLNAANLKLTSNIAEAAGQMKINIDETLTLTKTINSTSARAVTDVGRLLQNVEQLGRTTATSFQGTDQRLGDLFQQFNTQSTTILNSLEALKLQAESNTQMTATTVSHTRQILQDVQVWNLPSVKGNLVTKKTFVEQPRISPYRQAQQVAPSYPHTQKLCNCRSLSSARHWQPLPFLRITRTFRAQHFSYCPRYKNSKQSLEVMMQIVPSWWLYAINIGTQVNNWSTRGQFAISPIVVDTEYERGGTVYDIFVDFLVTWNPNIKGKDIVFGLLLDAEGQASRPIDCFSNAGNSFTNRNFEEQVQHLRIFEEQIDICDFGDLVSLILQQHKDFERIVQKTTLSDLNHQSSVNGMAPIHFAVVWPNGLQVLIERGTDVNLEDSFGRRPIHLAIQAGFTDSVRLLLGAECGLFISPHRLTVLQKAMRLHSVERLPILQALVPAIADRHKRLLDWANMMLPFSVASKLGMVSGQLHERYAPAITDMLVSNMIDIPEALYLDGKSVYTDHGPFLAPEDADRLWNAGFHDIDEPNSEGLTPFLQAWHNGCFQSIAWFVDKVNPPLSLLRQYILETTQFLLFEFLGGHHTCCSISVEGSVKGPRSYYALSRIKHEQFPNDKQAHSFHHKLYCENGLATPRLGTFATTRNVEAFNAALESAMSHYEEMDRPDSMPFEKQPFEYINWIIAKGYLAVDVVSCDWGSSVNSDAEYRYPVTESEYSDSEYEDSDIEYEGVDSEQEVVGSEHEDMNAEQEDLGTKITGIGV
ncbi:Arp Ankyrin repeat [Pyrenophora teres f. maculata]|nr:Arp Ankyrin repeat [Pyrenophora teres f. maculata]